MVSWLDWLQREDVAGGRPQGMPASGDWSMEEFYGTGLEPLLMEGGGVPQSEPGLPGKEDLTALEKYALTPIRGGRKEATERKKAIKEGYRARSQPASKELRDYIAQNAQVSRRWAMMGLPSDPRDMLWTGKAKTSLDGKTALGKTYSAGPVLLGSWASGPENPVLDRKKFESGYWVHAGSQQPFTQDEIEKYLQGVALTPSHERVHMASKYLAEAYPEDEDVKGFAYDYDLQHDVIGRMMERAGINSDDTRVPGNKKLDRLIDRLEKLSAELVKKQRPRGGR